MWSLLRNFVVWPHILLGLALFHGAVLPFANAAQVDDINAAYVRAPVFQNARTLVSRTSLKPNWIAEGDSFWYLDRHAGVKTFIRVDPVEGGQAPAFNHERLAAGISDAAGKSYSAHDLPFEKFDYRDGEKQITFRAGQSVWTCDLAEYICARTAAAPDVRDGEVLSPDGRWAVFIRGHNLWVRDTVKNSERALTRDGTADYAYARDAVGEPVTQAIQGREPSPKLSFSPDSKRILSFRADMRRVRKMAVIQTVQGRPPITHLYRSPIAGDRDVSQVQMIVVELENGRVTPLYRIFDRVVPNDMSVCWSPDSRKVCFTESERGYRTTRIHVADVSTGHVRTPVVERSNTYINRGLHVQIIGDDLVWSSERDGWNHLYRLDARSNKVHQITRGEWVVREVVYVDPSMQKVYFLAGGRESGEDPYYRHLYAIDMDGSNLQHLTSEPADHSVVFSPTGRYFIDIWSRLDQAPVSVLRRADGKLVRELQRADISQLKATGWVPPRTFTVKARDGHTDLYGAIFFPSNFDPSRSYPVIDAIYPGPQQIRTPKSFDVERWEDDQALAELGFLVVTIDAFGTPLRSKDFRDMSYRNMGSAGGLEDHISGLRQLAERHKYFDLDRVGIYGQSGGGYASARAILKFPDFYKVAVSSAGNHDQRSYWAEWGERFHDWPVNDETYASQANAPLAGNLKGKLLLIHGDMDSAVHHANTMQLVDALISANKDFDLLILPNRNHRFIDVSKGGKVSQRMDPYFMRKRWDYFVKNLLYIEPPAGYKLELR